MGIHKYNIDKNQHDVEVFIFQFKNNLVKNI